MPTEILRDACLRSFLALLSTAPYHDIDLRQVAAQAGVSLGAMRTVFADRGDLLAAFFRATDRRVLAESASDEGAGEGPRERLFEVLMRRLAVLEEHRAAVAALASAARTDPLLALRLMRLSQGSQRWMLAAAGLDCAGLAGTVRAKALAVLFAGVIMVWLRDSDPARARTMKVLEAELAKGEHWLGCLDALARPWRGAGPVKSDRPAS